MTGYAVPSRPIEAYLDAARRVDSAACHRVIAASDDPAVAVQDVHRGPYESASGFAAVGEEPLKFLEKLLVRFLPRRKSE